MEKFSVSVSCQWSRKRTLGDRARGRKPGPLLFWCREAPTRSTTASRTEWSPTTTGLARTSRSARTSCCLRTHTLHQQQAARQQQGLPPAGLAWEQHPLPRPVYNPSLSFPLGKEPARWLTLGHSRGATHSHATRFPFCHSLYVQILKQGPEAGLRFGGTHTPRASTRI